MRGEGPQELKTKCSNRLTLIPLDVTKSDQVSSATHLVASTLEDRSIPFFSKSNKVINILYSSELWAVVNNAGIACSSEIEWCPINIFEKVHSELKSNEGNILIQQVTSFNRHPDAGS